MSSRDLIVAWGNPLFRVAAQEQVLKRDLRLDNGSWVPKGTPVEVAFLGARNPKGSTLCLLYLEWVDDRTGRDYMTSPLKLGIGRLPDYVTGFTMPGISQMDRWTEMGLSYTPTGRKVVPEGWAPDGSPSWHQVFGLV